MGGWGGGGVGVESSTKFINMGLKVKDFILWRFTEKSTIFRRGGGGRFTKNQYIGGDCLKRGLGQFADLRGGLGVDTPMHIVLTPCTQHTTKKN